MRWRVLVSLLGVLTIAPLAGTVRPSLAQWNPPPTLQPIPTLPTFVTPVVVTPVTPIAVTPMTPYPSITALQPIYGIEGMWRFEGVDGKFRVAARSPGSDIFDIEDIGMSLDDETFPGTTWQITAGGGDKLRGTWGAARTRGLSVSLSENNGKAVLSWTKPDGARVTRTAFRTK